MYRLIAILLSAALLAPAFAEREVAVTMFKLKPEGLANSIGVVVIKETPQGLLLQPYLQGLPPGEHHFNAHQQVGCGSQYNPDGSMLMGMAAGPRHRSMPALTVADNGTASEPVLARNLRLSDLSQRTLVIVSRAPDHAMLPRHPTDPGPRIACGSLELY